MRIELFLAAFLSFFLAISASPVANSLGQNLHRGESETGKRVVEQQVGYNSNFPLGTSEKVHPTKSNSKSLESGIFGYSCHGTIYGMSYMNDVAQFGLKRLQHINNADYPIQLEPGLFIYPLLRDQKNLWLQGQFQSAYFVLILSLIS